MTIPVVSICLACAATPQQPPKATPAMVEELDQKIPAWLNEFGVPGVSVAAIENDRIAWLGSYRKQSPTQPAHRGTLYDVASLSKPVTAEVFLRLVATGRVSLDESMADHWIDPDVANDPRTARLTPRHVLTHRTGFKNWRSMASCVLNTTRAHTTDIPAKAFSTSSALPSGSSARATRPWPKKSCSARTA